jgi:hypothetical protein
VRSAADYLISVRSLIVLNPQIARWTIIREETQGDIGMFRYRLALRDGGLIEAVERFLVAEGTVRVGKYAFHWQDAAGHLLKRWDNAAHHPEIATHPHHVHEGTDDNVLPHEPVTIRDILAIISGG